MLGRSFCKTVVFVDKVNEGKAGPSLTGQHSQYPTIKCIGRSVILGRVAAILLLFSIAIKIAINSQLILIALGFFLT